MINIIVLELSLEFTYKSMIDKKTKTKEEKYLNNDIFNIQIPLSDSAKLNTAKHVLMLLD